MNLTKLEFCIVRSCELHSPLKAAAFAADDPKFLGSWVQNWSFVLFTS